jgi:Xaa-Pro aminopeptidase
VDCGAAASYYAGDLTRVFAVDQVMNVRQQEVYSAVETIQHHALSLLKPGITWKSYNQAIKDAVIVTLQEL